MKILLSIVVLVVGLYSVHGLPKDAREETEERMVQYNGTNWCGEGNVAQKYQDFGEHKKEDWCCRAHAHCPYSIDGFSTRYGLFNYRFYKIYDCRCHEIFHDCLKDINTTKANEVGNQYFNVIGFKCFRYQPQEVCESRSWYGTCERYETIMTAYVDETPLLYE